MRRTSVVAATLVLAGLPMATAAGPGTAIHGVSFPPLVHEDAVLYDQSANAGTVAVASQNFEASLDKYDAQAADDFVVPAGKVWTVTEIDVSGAYFDGPGPAVSENVTFYKDKAGKPGKVVKTLTITGADNAGAFAIKLVPKVRLAAGKYWVSVQANLDFAAGAGGQWGWGGRTTTINRPAKWVNPGNGFGTGCITYTNESTCIPTSTGDHLFVLKGKSANAAD